MVIAYCFIKPRLLAHSRLALFLQQAPLGYRWLFMLAMAPELQGRFAGRLLSGRLLLCSVFLQKQWAQAPRLSPRPELHGFLLCR